MHWNILTGIARRSRCPLLHGKRTEAPEIYPATAHQLRLDDTHKTIYYRFRFQFGKSRSGGNLIDDVCFCHGSPLDVAYVIARQEVTRNEARCEIESILGRVFLTVTLLGPRSHFSPIQTDCCGTGIPLYPDTILTGILGLGNG